MMYQRWPAPDLRSHFRSDNSMVYLPKIKGTVGYAQLIEEFNPDLRWDEPNRRVEGEVWCEVGDAAQRGTTWFSQQKAIPVFMKRKENESGFIGPVSLVRPAYFAGMSTNAPAVQQREEVLDFPLQRSSRKHKPHWYGYDGSAVARAISDSGWTARDVDTVRERVAFGRKHGGSV
jgi:hypothetical protein